MAEKEPKDNVIRPDGFQGPSSGDGEGGDTTVELMKAYIDSRDDAVESRLSAKLDKLPTKGTVWAAVAAIVGSIFTALAITLGIISFGGDRFDAGLSVYPVIQAAQQNQTQIDARQDAQMNVMDQKLDIIIRQTASR